MKSRETNRKLLFVQVLLSITIVIVTWTLSEKFLPQQPRLALFINLVVADNKGWH